MKLKTSQEWMKSMESSPISETCSNWINAALLIWLVGLINSFQFIPEMNLNSLIQSKTTNQSIKPAALDSSASGLAELVCWSWFPRQNEKPKPQIPETTNQILTVTFD